MTMHHPFEATDPAKNRAAPIRRAARRFPSGQVAWVLWTLLLAGIGCSDDRSGGKLVQPCVTQVVEGRIVTPEGRHAWSVGLRGAGSNSRSYDLYTTTDSSGVFSITAPLGRYLLGFYNQSAGFYYTATGPTDARDLADTLRLTSGGPVGPIEFRLGSCEIRVRTPPALEGVPVPLNLWRRAGSWVVSCQQIAFRKDGWITVRFPAVIPGIYAAGAGVYSGEAHPLPFGATLETAQRFEVEAGRRTEAEFEFPGPAVIRGSIDGSWQRLRDLGDTQSSDLRTYGPDSTWTGSASWSNSRSWSITSYDTTPVRLALRIGEIVRWIGGPDYRSAAVYTPALGETLTVPVEVESGVLWRVAWPDSLSEAGCRVELFDSLGVRLGGASGGYGAYGPNRFFFANLLDGSYFLRLFHSSYQYPSGWSDYWYEGAMDQADATPVRIRSRGELVVLETQVPPAAKIRGQLRISRPQNYAYLLARLWRAGDTTHCLGQQQLELPTDPFEFSGMGAGRYLLSIEYAYFGRWWYPGTWESTEAQPIDIHDFGQVEEATWVLPE
jgi:hypothetical protein